MQMRKLAVVLSIVGVVIAGLVSAPASPAAAAPQSAVCTSSVGPGIPPPASVPKGIPGFHAAWYGQSGYPTLCAGERSSAVVAYYNSGSIGWVSNRMGEMAFLGTSGPIPGQDLPSQLGGDGNQSPATGWPRFNRVAAQPADYVGPGQVAWFQFTIQAPETPGTYYLYLRPLIEGATWMEDFGVYWQVTVKSFDTTEPSSVTPTSEGDAEVGTLRQYSASVSGAQDCVDMAFVDAPGLNFEGHLTPDANGRGILSSAARFAIVNGTATSASYIDCVPIPQSHVIDFSVTSTQENAYVRPVVFRDLNGNNAADFGEPFGIGGPVRFVPPEAASGTRAVTAGPVSTTNDYFTDAAATATYRYDANDVFQRGGARLSMAQFEQVLSRGDELTVTYYVEDALVSVFNITVDRGRDAPALDAKVDSWDLGPTQNDVGLRITEPPTNTDDAVYSVQRAMVTSLGCDAGSGAYSEITRIAIGSDADTTLYVDRNLAVGAYCYRAGVSDPLTGATVYGYSQRAVIANPPAPVVRPRSRDARLTTSTGSPSLLDPGDVIKIAFDKPMQSPVARQMRVRDADGTIADVRCLQLEQDCTINPGTEVLGGISYPANTVVTITMRTAALSVAPGTTPGLQLNVTVTSGDFVDEAGNGWDVDGSDDVIIGAPD